MIFQMLLCRFENGSIIGINYGGLNTYAVI